MQNPEDEEIQPTLKDNDMEDLNTTNTTCAEIPPDNQCDDESSSLIEILMLGLDNAGKTTLLYTIKNLIVPETIRTIGFNVETLEYNDKKYEIWDVGGHESVRVLRNFYMQNKSVVIYVVDAADEERIEEAQQDLHNVMGNVELSEVHLVIVANKMDLVTDFKAEDWAKHLKLENLKQPWQIYACSATRDGEKLREISKLL